MRTGVDEERSPKYSHVERERRWLVDATRLPMLPHEHVLIEDRYIGGTRFRLRRMVASESGEVALKLAKKYPCADPTARPMVNAYLSEAEFVLFKTLAGNAVRKRRYVVDGFSVDLFDGLHAGLVLAEREAPDAALLDAIEAPVWAVCEVTKDRRFEGGALATLGSDEIVVLLRAAIL